MEPQTHWALSWASSVVQEEPEFVQIERSNEANLVYRLRSRSQNLFIKIGPALDREFERLKWLEGRLPAPHAIAFTSQDGLDALLMTAVEGEDLAELSHSLPPQTIITRLAAALQTMHATSTTDWPFGGIGVLVHGDACLPNFMYNSDRFEGYIDLGDMALARPEVDLAAAVWSLQYNLGPGHGLPFLREYGIGDANDEYVERLRLAYENDDLSTL